MSHSALASESIDVTIASGQQSSTAFRIDAYARGSYMLPATFTGTTITFEVSVDGETFVALLGATASAVSAVTLSGAKQIPFPAELFNFKHAKIKSGSAEGAERTIKVFLKS